MLCSDYNSLQMTHSLWLHKRSIDEIMDDNVTSRLCLLMWRCLSLFLLHFFVSLYSFSSFCLCFQCLSNNLLTSAAMTWWCLPNAVWDKMIVCSCMSGPNEEWNEQMKMTRKIKQEKRKGIWYKKIENKWGFKTERLWGF